MTQTLTTDKGNAYVFVPPNMPTRRSLAFMPQDQPIVSKRWRLFGKV